MPDFGHKYWPFNLVPESERTSLHKAQIRFFSRTFDAGLKPYIVNGSYEICFDVEVERTVRFVARGGCGRHWEARLADHGHEVCLGTLWNLPAEECIVFDGFDDMAAFVLQWLKGESLADSLSGIPVYRKHKTSVPLLISDQFKSAGDIR